MLTWMEDWLHGIIAVILFAVIVELLLPNSKFLKYTRLVIGLILLITILSPLLKIFEKDYMTQIDASYSLWEKQLNSAEQQTLSLNDIQAKAMDIQEKRASATLQLTAQSIASQMQLQLEQEDLHYIDKLEVNLELLDNSTYEEPYIKDVKVFVSLFKLMNNNGHQQLSDVLIDDVAPVEIGVNEQSLSVDQREAEIKLESMPEANIELIYTVLQRNWNIKKTNISFEVVDADKR